MKDKLSAIPRNEGYLVEFKDFSGGISGKELSISLSSFANTDGGTVYIGVTDRRQIQGLLVSPSVVDCIQNAAREGCSPSIPIKLRELTIDSKKSVIAVSVEKSGHLHSIASGQTYVRVGTQDKRVLGEELLRLAESKSQVSFEEKILDVGIEVIDKGALDEYYSIRRATSSMRGALSPEDFLIKIGLAVREKNQFRIKAAAFILFGKDGESTLMQRDFTFVHYDVEGAMYRYREDLVLPVVRLLDRLMELIRPHNKVTQGLEGIKRQETYLYPEAAIREALLNAFAHRDYRIVGLKNECRLYPDRLEILSAGSLPSVITLENIDKRHYSRNPKIMHALLSLGLTEELGQGINLMKNALTLNGNPPPEFIENTEQLKVSFRRPKGTVLESDFKSIIHGFLRSHPHVSRQQIESLCSLKKTRTKYLIQRLLREGFIEKVGQGPSTKYRLKKT